MKNKNTYKFTKYFIYILLVGQLWSNVFSYIIFCNHGIDDLIERASTENENENENENKSENKKEFEDKIVFSFFVTSTHNTKLSANFIHKEDLLPINSLKINTPPPEHILFI